MSKCWLRVRLGEVLREEKAHASTFDADGVPLLGVSNLDGLYRSAKPRIADMSRYLRVEHRWFAYNPMRINVGSVGWAEHEDQTGVISPDYVVFSCTDQIEPKLLYLFLRSRAGLQAINAETAGSVRERLYFDSLARIAIPLPPPEEQRRLVARIEELAARIHAAHALRRQAAGEAEALHVAWLRFAMLESSAHEIDLEQACDAIIDNLHSNPRYANAGVPCVRSSDVGWGTLSLAGSLRTDEAEYRRRTIRGTPQADDIVLVREGGGTGKCALVLPSQRFSLGQRVMILRPNRTRILPKFFLYQLLSPLVQEHQIMPLSKGSASPHLNLGLLRRFRLRLPSLPEQRRIVTRLDAAFTEMNALKRQHTEAAADLDALLPAVLDRAFKGDL